MKVIAVDIDDTLNNFSETLKSAKFSYDNQETYDKYIDMVRNDIYEADDDRKLRDLRNIIHQQCYQLATARSDAVDFMQWLQSESWKIVLLTYRNLPKYIATTRDWMKQNHIPYDYIFQAENKVVMCKLWKIPILIDDANFNISLAPGMGLTMYYPICPHNENFVAACVAKDPKFITGAKGFHHFDEVKQWIKSA